VIKTVVQQYIEQKKYAESILILEGMLASVPDSSELHYVAGIACEGLEQREKAIAHFKKISPSVKFYSGVVAQVSFWYQEQGKITEAIEFIQSSIQKNPENAEFRLYLATFYEENGELDKAVESLQYGLNLDQENDQLYFRLGVVYDKMNRKNDSIEAMKSALKQDPNNPSTLNYLGYTYADMGQNLDEAEDLIQQALTFKPDDGYIIDSLGWVFYQKGEYQKALEYLEKAAQMVPDDPTILEHTGDTYLKLNLPRKALECYRLALIKKNKDNATLLSKIQELEKKGY
jgi:tetratricopeptide (TPR) repeat protein